MEVRTPVSLKALDAFRSGKDGGVTWFVNVQGTAFARFIYARSVIAIPYNGPFDRHLIPYVSRQLLGIPQGRSVAMRWVATGQMLAVNPPSLRLGARLGSVVGVYDDMQNVGPAQGNTGSLTPYLIPRAADACHGCAAGSSTARL